MPQSKQAIYQLIKGTIKKSTFHIHLLQLKIMMCSIGKQDTNRFKASNRSKGFTIVNTLNLGVTLSYQARLVADDVSLCILLVLEYPLGPYDIKIILWFFHQSLHLVALKVAKFFMHGFYPIIIFKSFINLFGLYNGYERMMITE